MYWGGYRLDSVAHPPRLRYERPGQGGLMDHTILVVDDEPASLRALQRTLSPRYRVLAADSGEMGLEVLAREAVSLIVTDHRMPGLSGVEMLARARSSHPDAVRIVLTGYADVEALVEAIN